MQPDAVCCVPTMGYLGLTMPYYVRILVASLVLAVAVGGLAAFANRPNDVLVIDQSPIGSEIAPDSVIRVTFSRPVDRRSAETHLVLVPTAAGRFSWEGETLIFTPSQPFAAATIYRVTIRAGLRDRQGRVNRGATQWSFRTR
jgi:hypothetical protein